MILNKQLIDQTVDTLFEEAEMMEEYYKKENQVYLSFQWEEENKKREWMEQQWMEEKLREYDNENE